MHHRVSQPGCFVATHATQKDCHQQRRYLVVGQRTRGCCTNKKLNLFAGERATVTFFHNDVDCAHEAGSIADWRFSTVMAKKSAASPANGRYSKTINRGGAFGRKKLRTLMVAGEHSGSHWH